MISEMIISTCDIIIKCAEYIKFVFSNDVCSVLVQLDSQTKAIEYLNKLNKNIFIIYPDRRNRHKIYTLLKGKHSEYSVYSYGKENSRSHKKMIIKKIK